MKPNPAARQRPYRRSAAEYDAMFGRGMYGLIRRNFFALLRLYRARAGRVADVGCGTGDLAHHLASLGMCVTGVDRSPEMVALARRKSAGSGARFLVQDCRSLDLPSPVDVITCNYDVLNYLMCVEDLERAFRAFHRNLVDHGHLMFDMIAGLEAPRPTENRIRTSRRGVLSLWLIRVDQRGERRVAIWHRITTPSGPRWELEVHRQRSYPLSAILAALLRCGFDVLGCHDFETLGRVSRLRPRVSFVARRSRRCPGRDLRRARRPEPSRTRRRAAP